MSTPRQTAHPINPVFTQRWSPRAFSGEALSQEQVLTLLEAARWAPSASNVQPWHFVYALRGTSGWQPIFDSLVPANQTWAAHAGAIVVVTSAKERATQAQGELVPNPWHAFDAGAAWMSLALQASLSGLAAHAMGGFDSDKLRQAIGVPASHAIHAVVVVGKQGDKASLPEALQARELPSDRKPLAEVVSEGRF